MTERAIDPDPTSDIIRGVIERPGRRPIKVIGKRDQYSSSFDQLMKQIRDVESMVADVSDCDH